MLIEIHMIQNHSPANLNRDDLGAPKTCIFGGATRARISSQCLKRSIRRSSQFAAALEKNGGVRTRRLANVLARIANAENFDLTPEKLTEILQEKPDKDEEIKIRKLDAIAAEALETGGVKAKSKSSSSTEGEETDGEDTNTEAISKILLFLSTTTIAKMAKDLKETTDAKDLAKKFMKYIAENPCVPDIALNGRMTEVSKGDFKGLNFTVEAALSAAHAISTHAVVNEVDYFTAADDVPGQDAGAAHVNEAMFNSACFYKHFVIDFDQLKKNLGGDDNLARTTVRCFLEAAAKTNPSGKQHSFAAFNLPDGVLVEVKSKSATPVNYSNAFADPVPEKSERGLIGESIARLGHYAHDIATGYGIEAERFWFSPNLCHHLTWIANDKNEKPVGDNNFNTFEELVKAVMEKVA